MRYLLLLLLAGCQLVPIDFDNPPPKDWPSLDEKIVYLDSQETLYRMCGTPPPSATAPKGCTRVFFGNRTCVIYLTSKDQALLEHERWHCKGYVHRNSPQMYTQAWEKWKASSR